LIEVFFVIWVSKFFGEKAMDKGHSRGLFRGLAIGAWFTGELIAGIMVYIFFRYAFITKYLTALGGGIGGFAVIALILFLIPEKGGSGGTGVAKDWSCPACGFKNTGWRSRCFKCDGERSVEQQVPAVEEGHNRTWKCPDCGSINLVSDGVCYRCRLKKPAVTAPSGE